MLRRAVEAGGAGRARRFGRPPVAQVANTAEHAAAEVAGARRVLRARLAGEYRGVRAAGPEGGGPAVCAGGASLRGLVLAELAGGARSACSPREPRVARAVDVGVVGEAAGGVGGAALARRGRRDVAEEPVAARHARQRVPGRGLEVAGRARRAGRPCRALVPGVARAVGHRHRARRRLEVGGARGAARARRRPVRVRGARLAGGCLGHALRRPLLASRARGARVVARERLVEAVRARGAGG